MAVLDRYTAKTNEPLVKLNVSGMLYSNSFASDSAAASKARGDEKLIGQGQDRKLTSSDEFAQKASELKELYTYAFERAYLWNSLHGTE